MLNVCFVADHIAVARHDQCRKPVMLVRSAVDVWLIPQQVGTCSCNCRDLGLLLCASPQ